MTKFKQLSFWARQHKWSSRFIIVLSFAIMNVLAIISGSLLNDLDVNISKWFLILSIVLFCIVWLRYPNRKKSGINTYAFRKTCDSILIGATFFMFMYFGNRQTTPFDSTTLFASSISNFSLPKDSTRTYKTVEEFKKSLYDQSGKPLKWKERKKLLKQQIKMIKHDKAISDGGKVALIMLCVLVAIFLAYGVAALSCSLSCSGSEGAATIVAIFGFAGIILLTIFVIRAIVRKSKKEKTLNSSKPAVNN